MATVSWDPFREMMSMQRQLDRMFGSFVGREGTSGWLPSIDVVDGKDVVTLRADLPGTRPEDVDVEVAENVLTIRGERRSEEKPDEERFYRLERPFGGFERSVALPQGVRTDEVQASFEDGVLTVRVPKTEQVKPKRIEVHKGGGRRPEQISDESEQAA